MLEENKESWPQWFKDAIGKEREEGKVVVRGGLELEYLRWRPKDVPLKSLQPLVFLHGNGANAHWYAFIAPFFSDSKYDVLSFSYSGCGQSGYREDKYHVGYYADETLAILEALDMFSRVQRPIIVSHSLGSIGALRIALNHGELFDGIILTDVRVEDQEPEKFDKRREVMLKERSQSVRFNHRDSWKVHPFTASPKSKFQLVPTQPCNCDFVLDFIASSSAEVVPGKGWMWRGDCNRYRKLDLVTDTPYMSLEEVKQALRKVPMAFVYGRESVFLSYEGINRTVFGELRNLLPVVFLPNARHHLMLDEPIAFVSAISALLSTWPCSTSVTEPKAKQYTTICSSL